MPILPQLAQAADAAGKDHNFVQTIIMVVIVAVFFYFILFRPEQKRRKKMETMRSQMKKGDKVTAMGILGTIDELRDQSVILTMHDGGKIEVLKQAVTEVHTDAKEGGETK